MEEFDKLIKKLSDKSYSWCFTFGALGMLSIAIIFVFLLTIVLSILYWHDIYIWLGLNLTDPYGEENADFFGNRNVAFAAIVGAAWTIFLVSLTFWDRILTHKQTRQTQEKIESSKVAEASKKYQEASRMLGDDILTVRVASCQALRSLGLSNRDLALQCVQLLFLYIKNPYIDKRDIDVIDGIIDEEKFERIFPINEKLRADIQAAVDGFCMIFEYYHTESAPLDLGHVSLPSYFWKNSEKGIIVLPNAHLSYENLYRAKIKYINLQKATLYDVNLQKAQLFFADLRGANLVMADFKESDLRLARLQNASMMLADFSRVNLTDADLSEANMDGTILTEADLSGANMRNAHNLTKEQILSATWRYREINERIEANRPELPSELLQDKDILKWLEIPFGN